MAEVGGGESRSHGKGKKKKTKRLGVRLDMTPMVDVAFLLLTFFMLTTAFRLPQTMEISIPDDTQKETQIKIAESNILQIRVSEKNTIYWNLGNQSPQRVALKDLRQVFVDQSEKNMSNGKGTTLKEKLKLVVLIKIDKKAKYENMIDVVDELDVAILSLNEKHALTEKGDKLSPRFAFSPWNDKDKQEVEKAQ